MAKKATKTVQALPPGVLASDLKYPSWKSMERVVETLTFYQVARRTGALDWVITTLHIAKARRAGTMDRSYGIYLDGSVCRVGKGPHVKQAITVYVKQSRLAKLQKYLDLHVQGQEAAGQIRDRIGTRRAQGQLERAAGNTWWRWDK
jgi:hypothetical protein